MPIRTSEAMWEGNLIKGHGKMKLGSGAFEGSYSFRSRFENAPGTNPEELIGAAHAGCFSMALSMILDQAGYKVEQIRTIARVHVDKVGEGFKITIIELETQGKVPGIDERTFGEKAEAAKKGCPVSMALTGVDIRLQAKLVKPAT
ncbi:MAG TPA: OsmC family protein [Nitrospirota bacterium]|nr:OsmC family protein [Nitrospirota bacterium]